MLRVCLSVALSLVPTATPAQPAQPAPAQPSVVKPSRCVLSGSTSLKALRHDPPADRPAPSHDCPVRVAAKILKRVQPKYPPAAVDANIEGQVVIMLNIGANGQVTKAKVIRGLGYGLDEAALDAVKKWMFKPAAVDDMPIPSIKRVKVSFAIEE